MRILCLSFFLFFMTTLTRGSEIPFYLGTYTNASGSKGIYLGRLDTETGKLAPLTLAAESRNPGFLAFSPGRKFLYVAMEDKESAVGAFRVNPDGTLAFLNQQPSGGAAACHVSVDATGRNVFVANYSGGNMACFRTNPDGSLGERTALVQFSDPVPDRKKKSNGHAVYTDSSNRFVYACDLGTDQVWIFAFDAEKGSLAPLSPPSAGTPAGTGPRHLAIHPDGKFVYVNNEYGMSVTVFSRDPGTGALAELQNISTLPEGSPREKVSTAEIFFHPSGKWLYVSNRGHNSIASYSVGEDGRLALLEIVPLGVDHPRSFAIDPSGRWLIAAGMNSNKITVLKLDPATGKLSPTGETLDVPSPACVLF